MAKKTEQQRRPSAPVAFLTPAARAAASKEDFGLLRADSPAVWLHSRRGGLGYRRARSGTFAFGAGAGDGNR